MAAVWYAHLPYEARSCHGSPSWRATIVLSWNRVNTERARRLVATEYEVGDRVAVAMDLARLLNPAAARAAARKRRTAGAPKA